MTQKHGGRGLLLPFQQSKRIVTITKTAKLLVAYGRRADGSSASLPGIAEEEHLQVNFDGLPLFKSSSTQFWLIVGRICRPVKTDPFLISIFCEDSKPANLD
jgi:hypothetical protein